MKKKYAHTFFIVLRPAQSIRIIRAVFATYLDV